MKTVALAMITKNEADNLRRCLNSAKDYVDEIVVVDTGSEDNSVDVAKEFTDKVYFFEWVNDFSAARNFALDKVESDYVLALDSDDWLEDIDEKKFRAMLEDNILGIISIKDFLDPDEEGMEKFAITKPLRVFPKTARYVGKIHEQIDSNLKAVEVPVRVNHDGYLNRSKDKCKRNMDLLIEELKKNRKNPYYNYQLGKEYKFLDDFKNAAKYFKVAYKNADRRVSYFPILVCEYIFCLHRGGYMLECLDVVERERKYFTDYPEFLFSSAEFYLDLIMSDIKKYIGYLGIIETNYLTCIEIGDTDKYSEISGVGSYMAMHNLAAYYDALGRTDKAVEYYRMAAEYDYAPSIERLKQMKA